MAVRAYLLVASLTLVGCDLAFGPPDLSDPVESAKGWLRAVDSGDCERAWQHLSSGTREAAIELGERRVRDGPYYVDAFAPMQLECASSIYQLVSAGTVEPGSVDGDRARVHAARRQATNFLIPGFFPTDSKLVPIELDLVREGEEWRIVLDHRVPQERGWSEWVVDGVTIHTQDHGAGWRIWARATVDVSVSDLERAVMTWGRWPVWMEGLRAVSRVGTATQKADPILRVRLGGRGLGGSEAGASRHVATFPLRRYVGADEHGPGFAAGALNLLDPVPEPDPRDGEPFTLNAFGIAAYPMPGGGTRLQVIAALAPPPRLPGVVPLGTPHPRVALPPPGPERAARFLRALEREARRPAREG